MGRPRKQPRRYYRAKQSFAFVDPEDGQHYHFRIGDVLPDGKLRQKCSMFFEPLDPDVPIVEQATAAPGEKRGE